MATVNGEPGFSQLTKLNVTQSLLIAGDPVTSNLTAQEIIFQANSVATSQQPVGLDTPLKVEFGPAQSETDASLSVDGTITINTDGLYIVRFSLNVGREGSGGTAEIFGRILLDGVQVGRSFYAAVTSPSDGYPLNTTLTGNFVAGQTVEVEIVRDSAGTNAGGFFLHIPAVAGWNDSPSAKVTVNKLVPANETTGPNIEVF